MEMTKTPTTSTQFTSSETSTKVSLTSGNDDPSRGVRVLEKSEYKAAAACLADAFEHDDVAGYFLKTTDTDRWSSQHIWKLHVHIMECLVLAHIMKGQATVIGPNYDCVALWYV